MVDLDEELYMARSKGFKVKGKENIVCRFTKSLYDLKQTPWQWYFKFDGFMEEKDLHITRLIIEFIFASMVTVILFVYLYMCMTY